MGQKNPRFQLFCEFFSGRFFFGIFSKLRLRRKEIPAFAGMAALFGFADNTKFSGIQKYKKTAIPAKVYPRERGDRNLLRRRRIRRSAADFRLSPCSIPAKAGISTPKAVIVQFPAAMRRRRFLPSQEWNVFLFAASALAPDICRGRDDKITPRRARNMFAARSPVPASRVRRAAELRRSARFRSAARCDIRRKVRRPPSPFARRRNRIPRNGA